MNDTGLPGVVEPPFDFQKQLQELRKDGAGNPDPVGDKVISP